MSKPKVLLIQKYIPHYRIKIFEMLSQYVDLDIIYSSISVQGEKDYSRLNIKRKRQIRLPKLGFFHLCNLKRICNKYDAVIIPFDNSMQSVKKLRKYPNKKFKLISWGIGVLASRDCKYDSNEKSTASYLKIIEESDAICCYTAYPVEKYKKLGVDENKLFVANNTVIVNKHELTDNKDSIVFLGSLYKVKRVDELVYKYNEVYKENKDLPELNIVGKGEMYEQLVNIINELDLNDRVHLVGEITDDKELEPYLTRALACISPNQAGLSVLQSMGHGVPFITLSDAITGGERFNIENGKNGVLINDFDELQDVIKDISQNKEKYIEMGKEAYTYYWEKCTPEIMVKGFTDAIDYVLKGE